LAELRHEIDQLAKLKMNVFQFYWGMGGPWAEFSYDGKVAQISGKKESGFVAWPGASGTAVMLVNLGEKSSLTRISRQFSFTFQERPLPTDEDVERIVSERVISLLEARLRGRDKLQAERMQRFFPLVRSLSESEDESSLLAMLLDDFYQETFHAVLVPPDVEAPRPPTVRTGKPEARGSTFPGARRRGGGRGRR